MAHSTLPITKEPRAQGPRHRGLNEATERSTALSLFVSLRPAQWTKNLIVFAALLLGQRGTSPAFLDPWAIGQAAAAFIIFCGLSGVVYLINDVADRHADRQHPLKRHRPIASGAVSPALAIGTAVLLTAAMLGASWLLRPAFALVAVTYLVLLALYSGSLKHIVIIDVLTIAIGFVLRAVAGALVIGVEIGHWLLIVTLLLALFLALSKRRHELVLLGEGAVHHRRSLEHYSPYLLDQMIAVVTASTLIAYTVFTMSPETAERLGTPHLGFTVPFVLYGIFRYLYLVHQKLGGGSPAEMLLTDRPLLVCVALWAAAVVVLMYSPLGN